MLRPAWLPLMSVLVLPLACTEPGAPQVDAGSPDCAVPAALDFGAVALGDSFTRTFTLENPSAADVTVSVGAMQSNDGAFTQGADAAAGAEALAAGSQRVLSLTFAPTARGDSRASLAVRPAAGCPEVAVQLLGTGVDQVLTWDPPVMDFGYSALGHSRTAAVTFSNLGIRPVELTALATREGAAASSVFAVVGASPWDLTRLGVGPATRNAAGVMVAATAKVTLSFSPAALTPMSGTLEAQTDLASVAHLAVPLRGTGGGPVISVTPSGAVDLGSVAYFSGQAASLTRPLTITNLGTAPAPADPNGNLRLGPWTVTPLNASTSAAELCVGQFDASSHTCTDALPSAVYDPAIGLEAGGTHASIALPLRVTPTSLGRKEWSLSLASNDPATPTTNVTVRAEAVTLSPCSFSVTPGTLSFGAVAPGAQADLTLLIENLSPTDFCLVTNLELTAASDPAFSLPDGPVYQAALQGGTGMGVTVRATAPSTPPALARPLQGQLTFNVSSPTQATATVDLDATLTP